MQADYKIIEFLAHEFKSRLSKQKIDFLVSQLLEEEKGLDSILYFLKDQNSELRYKVTWLLIHYSESTKKDINEIVPQLLLHIDQETELGVKRNIFRSIQTIVTKNDFFNLQLYDTCVKNILSKSEPVATKSYSTTIAYEISKGNLDLLRELKLVILERMDIESTFFKARAKIILRKIDKRLK